MKKILKLKLRNAKNAFMPAFLSLAKLYTAIHTTRQFQYRKIKLDQLSIYQLQEEYKNIQDAYKYIKKTISNGYEHFTELAVQKYEKFLIAYELGEIGIAEYNATATGKKLEGQLHIYYDSARYFQQYLLKDYDKRKESLPKILSHLKEILKNLDINAMLEQLLAKASSKGKKRYEKTQTAPYNSAKTQKIFSERYRHEVTRVASDDNDFPHYLAHRKGEVSEDYYCVKIWLKEIHQTTKSDPLYINYVNTTTGSIIITHSWKISDKTQAEKDREAKNYLIDRQSASAPHPVQGGFVSKALNHSKIIHQTLLLVAQKSQHKLPELTSLTRYMVVNNDTVALVQTICRRAGVAPGQILQLPQGTPEYYAIFDTPNGKGMPFLLSAGRSILCINIIPGHEEVIEEMEFVFGKKES